MISSTPVHFEQVGQAGLPARAQQIVDCYREVFAADPWNEWKLCPGCGCRWGINEASELTALGFVHCGMPVRDYWPAEQVRADLLRQLTPAATCWIAVAGEEVVGFYWGYPVHAADLESELELPGLAAELASRFGSAAELGYVDEIAVRAEYRRRGIARELFRLGLGEWKVQGVTAVASRVMSRPPSVTYSWFRRLGHQEVASYDDDRGRVVLAGGLAR